MKRFFITGTDTEVGKTHFTAALLRACAMNGRKAVGYKPVAAGCEWVDGQPVNEDALALYQAGNLPVSLQQVNPVALMPAIAPHIAAEQAGITLSCDALVAGYHNLAAYEPDVLLVEGAGGWQLPLGDELWMPDVVAALALPVIIVVGMRLGCLNHALLTAQAIRQRGLPVAGWVANQLTPEPMPSYAQNLATLTRHMPGPLLAELPYADGPATAQHLSAHLTDILG